METLDHRMLKMTFLLLGGLHPLLKSLSRKVNRPHFVRTHLRCKYWTIKIL